MQYAPGQQTRYREAEVLSSSAERLVPLLYEQLLVSLKRGARHVRIGDVEGKHADLARSGDIVSELLTSLDFELGGEIAPRLASLYGFWGKEISEAGRAMDADRIEAVTVMVGSLHEAWQEASRMFSEISSSSGGDP